MESSLTQETLIHGTQLTQPGPPSSSERDLGSSPKHLFHYRKLLALSTPSERLNKNKETRYKNANTEENKEAKVRKYWKVVIYSHVNIGLLKLLYLRKT